MICSGGRVFEPGSETFSGNFNVYPGVAPIHKLYGNVPPFRVWFFGRPLINWVSNSTIFEGLL